MSAVTSLRISKITPVMIFVAKTELTCGPRELEGLWDPRDMFGGGRWKDERGAQEKCKIINKDLGAILKAGGAKNEGGHVGGE